LRSDIKELRLELAKTEEELDRWRVKYYALMDEFIKYKMGQGENAKAPTQTTPETTA
jgi:hypothetical protein